MLVSLPRCGPPTARNGLKRLSGYLHPSTFIFPLGRICNAIEKDTITEEPIPREARLAISLYRLAIDDYYLTIAEMAGIEEQTVGYIVNEVTSAIVDCLREDTIKRTHADWKSEEEYGSKILGVEKAGQFPCFW